MLTTCEVLFDIYNVESSFGGGRGSSELLIMTLGSIMELETLQSIYYFRFF